MKLSLRHADRWPRRVRRRAFAAAVLAAVATPATVLTQVATSSASTVPTGHTLTIPFLYTPGQPFDPDIYYADEGINITDNVYDTLLQYQPGTAKPKIIPDLATSWSVSKNGRNYTLHLRPHVRFHDGNPFTSADIWPDFQRRLGVNQGPAYMVADVTSVSTPNPLTAIIHLKQPNNAFLDYLASAYGPRMIDPAVLKAHAGKDHAESWLASHDAGTGAYTFGTFVPGQEYTLNASPDYWGPKPYYTTIHFVVTPSISTQELELEKGQLSMIEHGLPNTAVGTFQHNPNFKVYEFPSLKFFLLALNPNDGALKSLAVRKAILEAINKKAIATDIVPHGEGKALDQIYPPGELPPGTGLQDPPYDPSLLAKLRSKLAGQNLTIAYQSGDATQQQAANLIQAELAAEGVSATVVAQTQAQAFGLVGTNPKSPALELSLTWPDAANPQTWAHVAYDPTGGLATFVCHSPQATSTLAKAVTATNKGTELQLFEKAGTLYANTFCWDMLASKNDTMVAPRWLTGLVHVVTAPTALLLRFLHPVTAPAYK